MSTVDLSPIQPAARRPLFFQPPAATVPVALPARTGAPVAPPATAGPLAPPPALAMPGPPPAPAQPLPLAVPAPPPGPPAPKRNKRRHPPVQPQSMERMAEVAQEKISQGERLANENIRLLRLERRANILAAKQQALYWAAKREMLGREEQNIAPCPLMSGALEKEVDLGDRNVILTVMRILLGHLTMEVTYFCFLHPHSPNFFCQNGTKRCKFLNLFSDLVHGGVFPHFGIEKTWIRIRIDLKCRIRIETITYGSKTPVQCLLFFRNFFLSRCKY